MKTLLPLWMAMAMASNVTTASAGGLTTDDEYAPAHESAVTLEPDEGFVNVPDGDYETGGHMSSTYLAEPYYVDHDDYHLETPPHGYRWLRHRNGDFLMVEIATGLIAAVMAGR